MKENLFQGIEQNLTFYREAAEHMSKFRVRCSKCNKNFCANCQIEPYHMGKTCDQFKDFKAARKCRYC